MTAQTDKPDKTAAPQAAAAETVTVPLGLVEQTVTVLLNAPASQVYLLIQAWDHAVPGLFTPTNGKV